MAYCTVNDLKGAVSESTLIKLSNELGTATTINQTVVDQCIKRADDLINGYLRGGGYTVPLSPVPDIVNTWSVGLSLYELRTRRIEGEANETLENKKKDIIRQLKECQAGTLSLGIETAETGFQAGTYRVNKTSEDKQFNKDTLDQY